MAQKTLIDVDVNVAVSKLINNSPNPLWKIEVYGNHVVVMFDEPDKKIHKYIYKLEKVE